MVSEKSPLGERDGFKNKSQHPGSLVRRLPASQAPLLPPRGFVCLLSNTEIYTRVTAASLAGRFHSNFSLGALQAWPLTSSVCAKKGMLPASQQRQGVMRQKAEPCCSTQTPEAIREGVKNSSGGSTVTRGQPSIPHHR